jgi:hypothetical protein
MQTKEAIKFALTVSNGAVLSVIYKMSDAATTFPTPNGGLPSALGPGSSHVGRRHDPISTFWRSESRGSLAKAFWRSL